jgi:hypothetical protein
MKFKQILVYFLGMSVLTFVVSAIVTFLYSLIVHSAGAIDWETAFRFAIILGIILTWMNVQEKKKNKK